MEQTSQIYEEMGECGFTYLLDPLANAPESSFSTLSCIKLFQPFFFGVACEPATRKRRILRDSEQRKRVSRTRHSVLSSQPYDTALAMKFGKCNGVITETDRRSKEALGDYLRLDGPQDEFHRYRCHCFLSHGRSYPCTTNTRFEAAASGLSFGNNRRSQFRKKRDTLVSGEAQAIPPVLPVTQQKLSASSTQLFPGNLTLSLHPESKKPTPMSQVAYQQSKLRQQKLLQQQQLLHRQQQEENVEQDRQIQGLEAIGPEGPTDSMDSFGTDDESGSEDVIGSYIQEFLDLYPGDKDLPFLEDEMADISFEEDSYSFYDDEDDISVSFEEADMSYDDYDYDDDGDYYFNDSDFDRDFGLSEEAAEGRNISSEHYDYSAGDAAGLENYLENGQEGDQSWSYPQHIQIPNDPWTGAAPPTPKAALAAPTHPATKPRSTSAPISPVVNGEKTISSPVKKAAPIANAHEVKSPALAANSGKAAPSTPNPNNIAANNKVENSSSKAASPVASKAPPAKAVAATANSKAPAKPTVPNKAIATTTTTTKTVAGSTKTISTKSTTTIASVGSTQSRTGSVSMAKMTFTATATTTRTGKGLLKGLARPGTPPLGDGSSDAFDLDIRTSVKPGSSNANKTPVVTEVNDEEEVPAEGETTSKKKRRRRKKKGGAGAAGAVNADELLSTVASSTSTTTAPMAPSSAKGAPNAAPSKPIPEPAKNASQCIVKEDVAGRSRGKGRAAPPKTIGKPTPMGAVITELVRGKNAGKGGKKESWPELDRLDDSSPEEEIGKGKKVKKEDIWNLKESEERKRIKEFWLSLSEQDRNALIKLEKEAVLKKMKEQQRHTCSCSVCGRRRTAIEEELEMLYDAYYEELERYAEKEGALSLGAKGGMLSVADDLMKNEGKKFLEMMEKLAERRMRRQLEEEHELEASEEEYGDGYDEEEDGDEIDDGDEEDDDEDEDEDDEDEEDLDDDTMTEEQRLEEGKRMFQMFAAKMFEQRVLTAYREKVSLEKQRKLIEEEEERQQQEQMKKEVRQRKREQKKLKKQQAQPQQPQADQHEKQQEKLQQEKQLHEKQQQEKQQHEKQQQEKLQQEKQQHGKQQQEKQQQEKQQQEKLQQEKQQHEKQQQEKQQQEKQQQEKQQQEKQQQEKQQQEKQQQEKQQHEKQPPVQKETHHQRHQRELQEKQAKQQQTPPPAPQPPPQTSVTIEHTLELPPHLQQITAMLNKKPAKQRNRGKKRGKGNGNTAGEDHADDHVESAAQRVQNSLIKPSFPVANIQQQKAIPGYNPVPGSGNAPGSQPTARSPAVVHHSAPTTAATHASRANQEDFPSLSVYAQGSNDPKDRKPRATSKSAQDTKKAQAPQPAQQHLHQQHQPPAQHPSAQSNQRSPRALTQEPKGVRFPPLPTNKTTEPTQGQGKREPESREPPLGQLITKAFPGAKSTGPERPTLIVESGGLSPHSPRTPHTPHTSHSPHVLSPSSPSPAVVYKDLDMSARVRLAFETVRRKLLEVPAKDRKPIPYHQYVKMMQGVDSGIDATGPNSIQELMKEAEGSNLLTTTILAFPTGESPSVINVIPGVVTCFLCKRNPANVVLHPCLHVLCPSCADDVSPTTDLHSCPFCTKHVARQVLVPANRTPNIGLRGFHEMALGTTDDMDDKEDDFPPLLNLGADVSPIHPTPLRSKISSPVNAPHHFSPSFGGASPIGPPVSGGLGMGPGFGSTFSGGFGPTFGFPTPTFGGIGGAFGGFGSGFGPSVGSGLNGPLGSSNFGGSIGLGMGGGLGGTGGMISGLGGYVSGGTSPNGPSGVPIGGGGRGGPVRGGIIGLGGGASEGSLGGPGLGFGLGMGTGLGTGIGGRGIGAGSGPVVGSPIGSVGAPIGSVGAPIGSVGAPIGNSNTGGLGAPGSAIGSGRGGRQSPTTLTKQQTL